MRVSRQAAAKPNFRRSVTRKGDGFASKFRVLTRRDLSAPALRKSSRTKERDDDETREVGWSRSTARASKGASNRDVAGREGDHGQ
jgi:hypothetical protein